jgi:transcriptional regulator with GAF, ATPase, and Fis domain
MYLDLLSRVSLTVAGSRAENETLGLIVTGLVEEVGFALARIWLVEKAELRLRASAGRSVSGAAWTRTDGRFARFELGSRKIGRVGASGEAVIIPHLQKERDWVADEDWARREGMECFAAHPLVFREQILGVLGVFARKKLSREDLAGLRPFADHAAVSLANARAFEELQDLRQRLENENRYLREEVSEANRFHGMVGKSPALRKIQEQVDMVAPTDAPVLILGESGTGKELIARAIHERSKRKAQALVKVNCASVPRELFESEFFGHAKGSFTGALKDRVGRFQLADRGTLFLDEVGEIPLEQQGKLLRVLQEGEFERVGESATRRVSVRVMAATNRDLAADSRRKQFREDLFYRLSVFPLRVPPLRERKEDIPALAAHFAHHAARRMGLAEPSLHAGEIQALRDYDWPGNIRELQHVVERGVILGGGKRLVVELELKATEAALLTAGELREVEIRNYKEALRLAGGKVYGAQGAAARLGMPATTFASRLKALDIKAGRAAKD